MVYFRSLRMPRNPLLRLVFAAVGLAVGAVVLICGAVVGVLLLGVCATAWLVRQINQGVAASGTPTPPRPTPPGVIEGEFVVLNRSRDGRGV